MIAADPFQRDNAAGAKQSHDVADRRIQFRPAPRTGDRLRVKPPAQRIAIIPRAGGAHGKAGHRGLRSIIGQTPRQRVARPAMRAIDEGIEIKAAVWIEQFVKTILANGGVGNNAGRGFAVRARLDRKSAHGLWRNSSQLDTIDARQRRRLAAQRVDELVYARAFDFQQHALGVVAHEAVEFKFAREPMHERPKAHALHGAAHSHAKARRCGRVFGRRLVHLSCFAVMRLDAARAWRAARPSTHA